MLKKSLRQFSLLVIFAFCSLLVAACGPKDVYLYDKTGFIPESRRGYYNPNASYPGYNNYIRPNSASYYNPYSLPQQQYYPYYDQDYYYVPPRRYRNVEPLPLYESGIDLKH